MTLSWYVLYRDHNANVVCPAASRELALREARRLARNGVVVLEAGPLRPGAGGRLDAAELDRLRALASGE